MNRKALQSACIVGIFLMAMVAVIVLGTEQGKKNASVQANGIELSEKSSWGSTESTTADESFRPEENSIVYITPKGKKYHLYTDCPSLSNSSQIEGVLYASAVDGERGLCSLCEDRREKE